MLWTLITMLIILGIGVPILMTIYNGFVGTGNGTWANWTVANVTAYSTFELGIFQMIPILAALMGLAFILILLSGYFKKKDEMIIR